MIGQLRSELLKHRTTRTTAVLMMWMCGLITVVILMHVFGLKASDLRKASNQPMVFGWGPSIGVLFAGLLGAVSITSELRTGTIRPTLLATPRRSIVIGAKLIASASIGAGVGILATGLVSAVGTVGLTLRGIPITLSPGDFAQAIAGGALGAALWGVIGTGVGALVRNQVGAVVGLCIWVLLLETILIGDVPSAAKYSPGASAGAIAGLLQNARPGSLLAPVFGAGLLLGYAVLTGCAGLLATERRDIG